MDKIILALSLLLVSVPAHAQMTLPQMSKASGLADILPKASRCGFEIEQAALEKYYTASGLATPEILSYIAANVQLGAMEKPDASSCTLARTTAKTINIFRE